VEVVSSGQEELILEPDEVVQTSGYYAINIPDEYPGNTEIPLTLNIYSDDQLYWQDTFSIRVEAPEALSGRPEKEEFQLYPNPAGNRICLEFAQELYDTAKLEIFSLSGILIHEEVIRNFGQRSYRINLSAIRNGIYILKVSTPNYSQSIKLVRVE
jgi:hypothetical protein